MIKEFLIGIAIAFTAVLAWQGVNILPVIFLGGMIGLLIYFSSTKKTSKSYVIVSNNKIQTGFEKIGGQASAKREVLEALDFIYRSADFIKMGIRPLKGILMVGPPGTGKTLLAKASAKYTESVFISTSGSEFIEMYAGVGAQRVRQIFKQAKDSAIKEKKDSAIIFIDEIEILGGKRGKHSSHLEYDQTLNQLLVEMDGLNTGKDIKVLVIGATNRADMLDDALLRPGRFDRIVNVDLPDKEGRLHILKLHSANKPLIENIDLEKIASETFGFSGAHLESLTNEAAILAMREKKNQIEEYHFIEAIDKVMMGEKMDRRPDKEQLWRIALHETGHAAISEMVRAGSVSSVSVISRGKALGYMRQTPEKDNYIYSKKHLEDQISIMLAGAKIEELVLGQISTGSTNDFEQATKLVRNIIDSGMSVIGIVCKDTIPSKLLYETSKEIIKEQEDKITSILKNNLTNLIDIAQHILKEEKIDGEEFRRKLHNTVKETHLDKVSNV